MRHIEFNSVSAGFENCGLAWARDHVAKLSAHLSNEKRNEPLDWKTRSYCTLLWWFCRIYQVFFFTDLLWKNSILIPGKLIVTSAKFLWLIGGERKRGKLNMAMIETVRQRQKNSVDFASCYDNLCALQSSCPLGSITANLDELSIDCNADRIRHSDWNPILNALKINKTLKTVAFRSYWQQTLYPDGGT